MTEKVVYPSLTPVTSDAQMRDMLNRVIQAVGPLTGQHRVKANQAVTWLDLATAGYQFEFNGSGDFVLEPPYTGEDPDMSVPPAIANFEGLASFNFVTFSWDQPRYRNHSHVEIWRAWGTKKLTPTGVDVPTVLDDAVFRLISPSIMVSDTVLPGDLWRYWARNVSKTGVVGPWTSVDGMLIQVPESPSYLIDKISGEIREGDLYPALGEKIDIAYDGYFETAARVDQNTLTLSSHTATLASHDTAIQQQMSINTAQGNLINAAYTLRIDTGGSVHGFGLMVDGVTNRSDFVIRADRFAIAAPQAYDQSGKPIISTAAFPFIVDVTVPSSPKVLIKNAYIDKAYIESLVTGTLIADKVVGQTISGTHIRGGDIAIGANFTVDGAGSATMYNAFIKGTMQSNNYAAGSAGWQIRNDGYAEFRNAVVRGTIYADSGYFNGTVYAEKLVGGAYTKKNYSGYTQADSTTTAWRTACRIAVSRAMSVPRTIEISGSAGHYDVSCAVEGSGSGTLTRTSIGYYEVRILRDDAYVENSQALSFDVSATSTPSSGPVTKRINGPLKISLTASVPADSATHYYDLQFRFIRLGGDGNTGSDATAGCNAADTSVAVMYIENGDLT